MSTMEESPFASAFAGLPGFSPMMMINRSETCATRRLIQCTNMGTMSNDVTEKFYSDPARATDLDRGSFFARKSIIDDVAKWAEGLDQRDPTNDWTPILYRYEIVKTSAKRTTDWGDLVFTNPTLSEFLIVMIFSDECNCGNISHHDYDALTKDAADRFFCLLTYLHNDWNWGNSPRWIRATYTTPGRKFKLNPEFLSNLTKNEPEKPITSKPQMFLVKPANFVARLTPSELEKIDNMVAQDSMRPKKRKEPSVRDKVLGAKEDRPQFSKDLKHSQPRTCSYCKTVRDRDLNRCSRCKLVFYCSRDCQKAAWKGHKIFCHVSE